MADISVAVIVGSLRKDSINRKLANAVVKLNAPGLIFDFVEIGDLPIYNQDFEDAVPEAVGIFRALIARHQAVLFISPEYNRSLPGALKNAIDVGSRPMGQNRWAKKPVGLFGASPGAIGTAVMQAHLRDVVAAAQMQAYAGPEVYLTVKDGFFTEDGSLNESTAKFLQGWMDGYVDFVKKVAG